MDHRLQAVLSGRMDNYTAPFLWLHNEDDRYILQELERIHACGIRAVCLESRTHEEFCKEDWWSDCRLIMEFCREHDMKVWILDDKHFPSGYANGYYENHPELVQWNIVDKFVDVTGPVHEGCVYADVWAQAPGEEILGVFACRHLPDTDTLSDEIYDLTGNLSDGYVYFDLPEGVWRIVFLVKTRQGLNAMYRHYSDKLNPASTLAYLDQVYEPHWEHLSEYFGNVFLGFFSDEPGFGNYSAAPGVKPQADRIFVHYPWHESVREYFTSLYGEENAMRNLLSMWFDFEGLPYEEYRLAYMNFITDRYAENFTARIADWCHAHGVQFIGHIIEDNNRHHSTIHSAGHYFKGLRAQDMAGIDVVLHQIVPGMTACNHAVFASYREANAKFYHYTLAKLGASLAHITPHMNRRVMCEIFGAYGWAEGTVIMKYLTDHMLVRGINYFVPHAFSPKPNDPDCPPNFYATGDNPQYKYFHRIIGYMNRVCHLMAGSTHVNSCAILYDAESEWSRESYLPLDDVAKALYDHQLDYDILPPDSLSDMDKDGFINGERYGLILVPSCNYLRPAVKEALLRTGVRIATVTTKENTAAQTDFDAVPLADLPAYVRKLGLGDVTCGTAFDRLRYYHGKRNDAHMYMFVNEDIDHSVDTDLTLSGFGGGRYICYDAFNDHAEACESADGTIHLSLPPYHSVIILCGDVDFDGIPAATPRPTVSARTVTPTFAISLCERDGEPFIPYKETAELFSITGRGERPHFSGTIRYAATVQLHAGRDATLDLGTVGETAEVFLNGKPAGVCITPPYRFDISDLARNGDNNLEVLVTNTLGYRIHDMFSKFLMLPPTGLLGPITVEAVTEEIKS